MILAYSFGFINWGPSWSLIINWINRQSLQVLRGCGRSLKSGCRHGPKAPACRWQTPTTGQMPHRSYSAFDMPASHLRVAVNLCLWKPLTLHGSGCSHPFPDAFRGFGGRFFPKILIGDCRYFHVDVDLFFVLRRCNFNKFPPCMSLGWRGPRKLG